jgi:hypothetical protein
MIVNLFNSALEFSLTASLPLLVLALLSAIPAARQPASIKNATIWEAMIRVLFSAYFLGGCFSCRAFYRGDLSRFWNASPAAGKILARAGQNDS